MYLCKLNIYIQIREFNNALTLLYLLYLNALLYRITSLVAKLSVIDISKVILVINRQWNQLFRLDVYDKW